VTENGRERAEPVLFPFVVANYTLLILQFYCTKVVNFTRVKSLRPLSILLFLDGLFLLLPVALDKFVLHNA
jgi:hypothetical protein